MITSIEELKGRIRILETRKEFAEMELKRQVILTYSAMKPSAVIRNTFKELAAAPDFKGDIAKALFSIAAGFLSKKLAIGSSHNPIKVLLGNLLQAGVTNTVANHSDEIKSAAFRFIRNILTKQKSAAE
jgi:hypothetical protein